MDFLTKHNLKWVTLYQGKGNDLVVRYAYDIPKQNKGIERIIDLSTIPNDALNKDFVDYYMTYICSR